jgi:hypothetical protein
MANQAHLDVLKQGVEVWNQWRQKHLDTLPDLAGADLSYTSLVEANLWKVDLTEAKLIDSSLRGATLVRARLNTADLSGANFWMSDLTEANLSNARLDGAIFYKTILLFTLFGDVYLSTVEKLETAQHVGPSTVGIDTIIRSNGKIPEVFLRGAGIPDIWISYARSLVSQPIDYYSCFISYSSRDEIFANRLYVDLQSNGVRCWFAPHHMRIGDEIRTRIDESIRIHDKLLLILSGHALSSNWVQREVETAFEKELHQNQLVLFPIMLDETVMHATQAWAADIRRSRHIGDFTKWEQHDDYQQALQGLLRDLKAASETDGGSRR